MKQANLLKVAEFVSADGCAISELVGNDAAIENGRFSVVKTVVPPSVKAQQHYHVLTEELYIVTGGAGRIVVDDKTIEVSVGDAVLIEIGERHFAEANADAKLEFLAISLPAYGAADFIVED